MSKQKKAKKVRRPNLSAAINVSVAAGQNGGSEQPPVAAAVERKPAGTVFDYTYVKKDLARIGVLAGSFIAVLVILSFFINR
jgi:hypothetical protein